MFANLKPQSAYGVMVNPRGEKASPEAMSTYEVQVCCGFVFDELGREQLCGPQDLSAWCACLEDEKG